MPGSRLLLGEREEIRAGLERGDSLRRIAVGIGRSASTVSRELARNRSPQGYRAHVAQRRADDEALCPRRLRLQGDRWLCRRVRHGLEAGKSPQWVAWELAAEGIS